MLCWRGKRGFVYPSEGVISAYTSSAHFPICILLPARASLSKRKSPSSAGHPHPLFPRCVCGWFGYASSAHLPICILLPARASLSKRKSPSSVGHPHPLFPRCVCGWFGYTSSAHFPICILLPARASLSKRKSPSSVGHPHPLSPRCVCGWFGYTSSAHLPICILLPARASLSKRKSPSSEEHPHPLFPRYLGAGNISCWHNVLLFGALRRRTFRYVNYCLRALPCLIAERYAFVCVSSPRGSRSCSDGGGGAYFGG